MRRTRLATKWTLRVVVVLMVAGFGFCAEQKVLDLRKVPAAERRSMGVPGSSVVGVTGGGGPLGNSYRLPLEVSIKKLAFLDNRRRLEIELQLLNAGTSPVGIPSCKDAQKVHAAGQRERRTFEYGLIFLAPTGETTETVDATFTSFAMPSCSTRLDPGASLLLIDYLDVPGQALSSRNSILVRAFVNEFKLENNRYYVESSSQQIESAAQPLPK